MSPSVLPPGVWTKLVYRKPPPTPEFLETPLNLFSEDTNFKDERDVFIKDVRNELQRFSMEKEGFEFMNDTVEIKNWDDEDEVRRVIVKETPELIKKRLGAKRVFLVTERIRRSDSSGIKSDTTPVFAIHGDATPQSGLKLLQENVAKMEPKPKSLPPSGRVMLVNVWRPLKTITRDPLAFLVPSSMEPGDRHQQIFSRPAERFKVFGKPLGDYWLDTVSHNERHEWVFLKHQERHEPVMFVQWDSEGLKEGRLEQKMSLLHTCFEDAEYADDPPRTSIELKCLVFFDD